MDQVNVHQAKTQLSRLLARVEQGEEIVIARDGKPVAKLVPHRAERAAAQAGLDQGQDRGLADDFDEYDEQLARDFGIID